MTALPDAGACRSRSARAQVDSTALVALFFEPESSTAALVLEAMATPPEQTGGLSWVEVVRQREALSMTPQLEPGYARVFHEQVFGRANRGAM